MWTRNPHIHVHAVKLDTLVRLTGTLGRSGCFWYGFWVMADIAVQPLRLLFIAVLVQLGTGVESESGSGLHCCWRGRWAVSFVNFVTLSIGLVGLLGCNGTGSIPYNPVTNHITTDCLSTLNTFHRNCYIHCASFYHTCSSFLVVLCNSILNQNHVPNNTIIIIFFLNYYNCCWSFHVSILISQAKQSTSFKCTINQHTNG